MKLTEQEYNVAYSRILETFANAQLTQYQERTWRTVSTGSKSVRMLWLFAWALNTWENDDSKTNYLTEKQVLAIIAKINTRDMTPYLQLRLPSCSGTGVTTPAASSTLNDKIIALGDTQIVIPMGYILEQIILIPQGNCSVKIGTTVGGEEISPAQDLLDGVEYPFVVNLSAILAQLTIYLTGTPEGSVIYACFKKIV